ncbi:MAG: hypothetical protein HYX69_06545 [Planctomycetia bacterium]|nr:hypothetical protein [Planctomycetia bacterium]
MLVAALSKSAFGSAQVPTLDIGLLAYLNSLTIDITDSELCHILDAGETTLLLDGIDEGLRSAPWLLDEIRCFAARHRTLHMVVSARTSGVLDKPMPFMSVTLMPFTVAQRDQFLDGWFGAGGKKYRRVIANNLSRNQILGEIVRNPLLATVLCVLAEHGIPLPDTEVRLYDERMRLFTGQYDVHKRVPRRLEYRSEDLIAAARRIAFAMHEGRTRELSASDMYRIVGDVRVSKRTGAAGAKKLVDELVDPCSVLVTMSGDGRLGFGHLRFQEHLAATEMALNRSIDVIPLLADPGWRDAFVRLARMTDSLDWLIDEAVRRMAVRPSMETFRAMLDARTPLERDTYTMALRHATERIRLADDDDDGGEAPQDWGAD